MRPWQRIAIGLVLAAEALGLTYAVAMAWLMSGWFLDDHVAASMLPHEWWIVAAQRVAFWSVAAVLLSLLTYGIGHLVARALGVNFERPRVITAIPVFVAVEASAIAGALQFALTRPFL